jgi:acetylornithine deacetylase
MADTAVTDLTRGLVEIPSHEAEERAGDYIENWLREHTDAAVERDPHGNVIARRGFGGDDDTPGESTDRVRDRPETTLALVGHHDVVPPDESQLDGEEYIVERRGGRLHGRGAADMKGAVAAEMCAFRNVDREGLVFVSFVGEEVGGRGARAAIADGFVPDYAVVGEGSTGYSAPGVTDVAIAHKGRRASTLVAEGEAAHASEPDAGENAIYHASDAIAALRELSAPETTVLDHHVQGSVVVTEIEGGSAWNVIPERCEITVDERTVPGERAPLGDLPGVRRELDQDLPPMACDDEGFAEAVLVAARRAQDSDPEGVVKPHATDAGWLADAGTTCVVCGPAEPGEAHTATESVSLDVLDRCREIYERAARRVLE